MTSPFRLPMLLTLASCAAFTLGCAAFLPKEDDDDDDEDEDWWADDDEDSGGAGGDSEDDCEEADPRDDNCDGEVDCDEDSAQDFCVETGLAQQYWYATVTTRDLSTMTDGGFGMSWRGVTGDEGVLCTAYAEWQDDGDGPDGCPDCDWAFAPSGTGAGPSTGDYCDDFGVGNGELGAYADAGYFVYPIGFAEEYYWAAYQVTVTEAVFLYVDEWFVFAYNYGSYEAVYGDKFAFELYRASGDGNGGAVYSYYYPH